MPELSNKEIAQKFFKRFSVADVEGALSLLDDKVSWQAMGSHTARRAINIYLLSSPTSFAHWRFNCLHKLTMMPPIKK